MALDKDKLRLTLSTIKKSEEGYVQTTNFLSLWNNVRLSNIMGVEVPRIGSFLQYIHQDITNIGTISKRLSWQNKLRNEHQIDEFLFDSFASCDIDFFHIEFRSIFDYLAKIIVRLSNRREQVPDEGFNVLRNWLTKDGVINEDNAKRLGEDFAKLVLSCDWFDNIKDIRDLNMHRGGFTLVFPEQNRILFQIYEGGYKGKIIIPEIMFNENIADFELYAGLYFGYLIAYLEEASETIDKHLTMKRFPQMNVHTQYREIPEIYNWVEKLV